MNSASLLSNKASTLDKLLAILPVELTEVELTHARNLTECDEFTTLSDLVAGLICNDITKSFGERLKIHFFGKSDNTLLCDLKLLELDLKVWESFGDFESIIKEWENSGTNADILICWLGISLDEFAKIHIVPQEFKTSRSLFRYYLSQ